jgi:hypothetical protein
MTPNGDSRLYAGVLESGQLGECTSALERVRDRFSARCAPFLVQRWLARAMRSCSVNSALRSLAIGSLAEQAPRFGRIRFDE